MDDKYYRITCNEIGIYEYLKKYMWQNITNPAAAWNEFINSKNVNWLKKPEIYNDKSKEYCSYFNANGYKNFIEKTLPLLTKWIDKNIIKLESVKIDPDKIIYQDEFQIVIEVDKIKKQENFVVK